VGRAILISGRPGIGKTTVFNKVLNHLAGRMVVHGFISREIRKGGERIGFELEDLLTGQKGWLARSDLSSGPKVGKYRVVLSDLERIGVAALETALASPSVELVAVDELAPMEFSSPKFKTVFEKTARSGMRLLCTVQLRMLDEIRSLVEKSAPVKVFLVNLGNRDTIDRIILEEFNE